MEDRPHLSRDRGEAAQELRLDREPEQPRDDDGREALRAVEQPAGDTVQWRYGVREIGSTELARSGRSQIDAFRARDPIRERDRGGEVRDRDGDERYPRTLARLRLCSPGG